MYKKVLRTSQMTKGDVLFTRDRHSDSAPRAWEVLWPVLSARFHNTRNQTSYYPNDRGSGATRNTVFFFSRYTRSVPRTDFAGLDIDCEQLSNSAGGGLGDPGPAFGTTDRPSVRFYDTTARQNYVATYYPNDDVLLLGDWLSSVRTATMALQHVLPKLWKALRDMYPDRFQDVDFSVYKTDASSEEKIPVMLGADPEFELVTPQDSIISARDITIPSDSHIGRDGAGWQIELRPEPSETAEGLVENIGKVIAAWNTATSHKLSLRGDIFPLGGHIHISGCRYSRELIGSLDDFIGIHTLKLSGHARQNYKHLGAAESGKSHGGFEYRVPPVAWMWTPDFARHTLNIVLGLIKQGFDGLSYEQHNRSAIMMARQAGLNDKNAREWYRLIQNYHELQYSTRRPIYPEGWGAEWKYDSKPIVGLSYNIHQPACRRMLTDLCLRLGLDVQFEAVNIYPSYEMFSNMPELNPEWRRHGRNTRSIMGPVVMLPYAVVNDTTRLGEVMPALERRLADVFNRGL